MRVVVALGGNALLKRAEPMNAEMQRGNVRLESRTGIRLGLIAPVAAFFVNHPTR